MTDRDNQAVELVEFFRNEGFRPYGHTGDYEGWSPEQTAIHFLREHLKCGLKTEWPIKLADTDDAELVHALEKCRDRVEGGMREAVRMIKLACLGTDWEAKRILSRVIRICIDAGVTESYRELDTEQRRRAITLPVAELGNCVRAALANRPSAEDAELVHALEDAVEHDTILQEAEGSTATDIHTACERRLAARNAVIEAIAARIEQPVSEAEAIYREGWEAGYATGDAGGRPSALADDWAGSNARLAIRRPSNV